VTFLGSAGPWGQRVYLVGGLAPRYIVGKLPEGAAAHVGTTDVDLVIELVLGDATFRAYRALETNLRSAGFERLDSCTWVAEVSGLKVRLEFLCDTTEVEPGRIFMPTGQQVGGVGAFNIPGAALVAEDFRAHELEAERFDGTGLSRVTLRVAGLLPFVVLKVLAFQERHENKDSYDLVFCLLNYASGPENAGAAAAASPVRDRPFVVDALELLGERFADVGDDGPGAYAAFLADPSDTAAAERLRREAVVTVRRFLGAFRSAGER
jgi:hypothetical protein